MVQKVAIAKKNQSNFILDGGGETWVGKAIVSLRYFLEPLLCNKLVVRIFIGMPLESLQTFYYGA